MRMPRMTTRRWMLGVVLLCAMLGAALMGVRAARARRFRRLAEYAARMERRCREIDAMDPNARAREADYDLDDPYLLEPEWNRKMIGFWEEMKDKYSYAADHPWLGVAPDPPTP
jgi:hypothetical protein